MAIEPSDAASQPTAAAAHCGDSPWSILKLIVRMLLIPACGAGIAYLLISKLFIPHVGLGEVQRAVALGQHLDEPLSPAPCVAFLGDSITREGVDARVVAEFAPAGWHAQNLAVSACMLNEVRIILPKVIAARPGAISIGFRPDDLGCRSGLNLDKAYAYAMGGFMDHWTSNHRRSDFPNLNDEQIDALFSSRFEQDLHFRTAPLVVFSDQARVIRNRKLVRMALTDNWTDPFEMLYEVRDSRRTWHIAETREGMRKRLRDCPDGGVPLIAELIHTIRAAGISPVLLIVPILPELRDDLQDAIKELRTLLAGIAREESAIVIDAYDLLGDELFADALHPTAEGRVVLSRFIGEHLGALGSPQEKSPANP